MTVLKHTLAGLVREAEREAPFARQAAYRRPSTLGPDSSLPAWEIAWLAGAVSLTCDGEKPLFSGCREGAPFAASVPVDCVTPRQRFLAHLVAGAESE